MKTVENTYQEAFLSLDLFASAGLSKPKQEALSLIKKNIASYNLSQVRLASQLNNLSLAKGANLERIAHLIGFFDNCLLKKEDFLLFLLAKNSNGSLDFWQKAFNSLGLNTQRIDIWQNFEINPFFLDNTCPLDACVLLDGDSSLNGYTRYEAYVDFLVLLAHDFSFSLQDFIQRTRYVGRRVLAREVLECYTSSPNSLVYPSKENLLDDSWILDANLFLSFDSLEQVNELRIGKGANGKPPSLEDSNLSDVLSSFQKNKIVKRSSSLVFQEWDVSDFVQDYDEIGFFCSGKLKFKITFSEKRRFVFSQKIVRLNIN